VRVAAGERQRSIARSYNVKSGDDFEVGGMKLQPSQRQAQGPWADLALHTLGWKAFQDLCA